MTFTVPYVGAGSYPVTVSANSLTSNSLTFTTNAGCSTVNWVAGGNNGGTTNYSLACSSDGINWVNLGPQALSLVRAIASNGSMWVAVGYPATSGGFGISYSTDGNHWTGVLSATPFRGYAVAWNGSMWVAGGSTASISFF